MVHRATDGWLFWITFTVHLLGWLALDWLAVLLASAAGGNAAQAHWAWLIVLPPALVTSGLAIAGWEARRRSRDALFFLAGVFALMACLCVSYASVALASFFGLGDQYYGEDWMPFVPLMLWGVFNAVIAWRTWRMRRHLRHVDTERTTRRVVVALTLLISGLMLIGAVTVLV